MGKRNKIWKCCVAVCCSIVLMVPPQMVWASETMTNSATNEVIHVTQVGAIEETQGIIVTASSTTDEQTGQVVTNFMVTRSDATAEKTFFYKTVNGSAVGGVHYEHVAGELTFAAGETEKTVTVNECVIDGILRTVDKYQVNAREYFLKVWEEGKAPVFGKRTIDKTDATKNYWMEKGGFSVAAQNSSLAVEDEGWGYAYTYAMIKNNSPYEYMVATKIEKMYANVTFSAKEENDGYQYMQIYDEGKAATDDPAGKGDPGSVESAYYIAGFTHEDGSKNTSWANYRFPVRNAGGNKLSNVWNSADYWQEGNSVGKLMKQLYHSGAQWSEDGGSLILPIDHKSLYVGFDASGTGSDNWNCKNITFHMNYIDETVPEVVRSYVETDCGTDNQVMVSLVFNEIVHRKNGEEIPVLSTTAGDLTYAGGEGTNVMYFVGIPNEGTDLTNIEMKTVSKVVDMAENDAKQDCSENHVELSTPVNSSDNVTSWDCVYFGKYYQNDTNQDGVADTKDEKEFIKWRVLNVQDGKALLMSDQALTMRKYNTIKGEDVYWGNSTLRSWLNGYAAQENAYGSDYTESNFLDVAFTKQEKAAIQTVELENKPYGNEKNGGPSTKDKVFCLSMDEIYGDNSKAYGFSGFITTAGLPGDGTRQASATAFAAAEAKNPSAAGQNIYYWTRTPGYDEGGYAVTVNRSGAISWCCTYYASAYVRPCIWVDLENTELLGYAGTVKSDGTVDEVKNYPVRADDVTEEKVDSELVDGMKVYRHTQDEIKAYMKENNIKLGSKTIFETEYSATAPYATGSLTEQSLNDALAMLNAVRYVAGISYDVKLSAQYNQLCQTGSLVNYMNDELSHYPTKPDGMEEEMYQTGYQATANSNLAYSSGYEPSLSKDIVNSWMYDGDSMNIVNMGHRRWILSPTMQETGFGLVGNKWMYYSSMYVMDMKASENDEYGIAWPAQNMPIEFFGNDYPWTVSLGKQADVNNITVTLVRKSDEKAWNFSADEANSNGYFNVSNKGCGQLGCVIFRPDEISYEAGNEFEVSVKDSGVELLKYSVAFFDAFETEASDDADDDAQTNTHIENQIVQVEEEVSVETITDDNTNFGLVNEETGEVTLVYNASDSEQVTIPESIAGKDVTTIGTGAFSGNDSVNSIVIPEGVESIESGAFWDCGSLNEVTIPNSVTDIATDAFVQSAEGDTSVSTVTIVAQEGSIAAQYAKDQGMEVTQPKTENENQENNKPGINDGQNTDSNKKPDNNKTEENAVKKGKVVQSEDGQSNYKVESSDQNGGTVTYMAPAKKNVTTVVIPDSITINGRVYRVTAIADNAFKNLKKLKTVKMGSNITKIGNHAFSGCKKLKNVIIGKNVTIIGTKSFYKCVSIVKLTIPGKVKKIGKSAFEGCKKIKKLTIKTKKLTTKTVKKKAFKGVGSKYYKKVKVKVPGKKYLKTYKTLLRKSGLSKKVEITK